MTSVVREEQLDRERVSASDRRNGLWLGLISGMAFGLSTWGLDALALGSASVDRPWIKLAMGLTISLAIGALAGWLTAVIGRGVVGVLVWGTAGIAYAWLAGHIPFDGQSAFLRLVEPQLGDITAYPFGESAKVRTILLMVIVGGLSALAGVLELVLLDQAKGATSGLARAFSMALTIPFFGLAGIASDGIINRPLREPLLAIHHVIEWAVEARSRPVDPSVARQRHLGAVGGIEDLIGDPYEMMLGSYDGFSLMSFSVEVDFDGTWARCTVLASSPGYCAKSDTLYEQALACLLDEGQDCTAAVSESVRPWLVQSAERGEAPASIVVADHAGPVVVVDVNWSDGSQDVCVFTGTQPITLRRCSTAGGT
jgi:hypothetical protein